MGMQIALVMALATLLIWAAICDFRHLQIPNWIPIGIAVTWLGWLAVAPVDPAISILVAVATFAVGTALFSFKFLGGGDVKLISAVALWAGGPQVLTLIFQIALAGGVLAFLWILAGRVRMALAYYGMPVNLDAPATKIPYGIAIAAGGLLLAARLVGV